MAKDYLDVEATEPLANGDGLNVLLKRDVVGFRANTVEKSVITVTAFGQMICLPTCIKSVRIIR